MSSPTAVIGLVWDGFDLQRPDLDLNFWITEGLDSLPETRGDDDIIPFRSGRRPAPHLANTRPVVAMGWAAGSGATPRASYRAYVDALKRHLDPGRRPGVLVATLEDASIRWINAVPRNLIGGEGIGGEFRPMSIEWEALDPYWYGNWGTLSLDSGVFLDAGATLDSGADVVVLPTAVTVAFAIDTLGTASVERIRVTFTGPSVSPPGFAATLPTGEAVGFTYGAPLTAGQTLVVDNYARTVLLGGVSRRDLLTLMDDNANGEYARLGPGENDALILGQPTEARIHFNPTWL